MWQMMIRWVAEGQDLDVQRCTPVDLDVHLCKEPKSITFFGQKGRTWPNPPIRKSTVPDSCRHVQGCAPVDLDVHLYKEPRSITFWSTKVVHDPNPPILLSKMVDFDWFERKRMVPDSCRHVQKCTPGILDVHLYKEPKSITFLVKKGQNFSRF